MAGIYIHIPFCRKACHYCNFHFSTSLHRKPALVAALIQEISKPLPFMPTAGTVSNRINMPGYDADSEGNDTDKAGNGTHTAGNRADGTGVDADSEENGADTAGNRADSAGIDADSEENGADTAGSRADSAGMDADSEENGADTAGNRADSAGIDADSEENGADTAGSRADSAGMDADSEENGADIAGNRADSAGMDADTIYFGGGTPSLLDATELEAILTAVKQQFVVAGNAELTLEANPDDITPEKLALWRALGFNRLSIGVQSFFEADLRWMNRAHNAEQAVSCIALARSYGFTDLTIDLIYGTPTLSDTNWKANVDQAIALGINHVSCYALTVEEKTPLNHFIEQGKLPDIDPEKQRRQFLLLMDWAQEAGFEHYEISNFAKPGHRSRHNSNYWSGNAYIGFGPSAHSFDGRRTRWWNVANNALYIDQMQAGIPVFEPEVLTPTQRLNEYIMTSLRTMEGLDLGRIPSNHQKQLLQDAADWLHQGLLMHTGNRLVLTRTGKLFADRIAGDLFV